MNIPIFIPSQNVQYLYAPGKHCPSATLRIWDSVFLCGWTGTREAAQALNVDLATWV